MGSQLVPDARERRPMLRRLWARLRPVDRRFHALFGAQAALAVDALAALAALLADVRDPDGRVREIEAMEKRADSLVDEVLAHLRRSLFPPFPREIVYDLANRIDDVLDLAEDAAQCLLLYHVTAVTPEAQRLAELALRAMRRLQAAIDQLPSLDDPRSVLAACAEVDDLEAEADHVLRAAMSRLFREQDDAREIVRFKAIYETLEALTDKCKDIASRIEAVALRGG